MQVYHQVPCNDCSSLASCFCQICRKHFSCEVHRKYHCNRQMIDCPKVLDTSFVSKKINEAEHLKEIIPKIRHETLEKLNKITDRLIKYTGTIWAEFNDGYENACHAANISTRIDQGVIKVDSPWVLSFLSDDSVNDKLIEEYKHKEMYYDRVCEDIESILDEGDLDVKAFKGEKRGGERKNYVDLDREVTEKWKETKMHLPGKVIDAFSDLIMFLEDNKNKVLTEEVKITNQMSQIPKFSTFVSKLADICPNLKKISIESSPLFTINILKALPGHKSLIDLSLDFLLKPTPSTGLSLENLNSLPSIQRLVLKNVYLINNSSHQMPNLTILELINNSITPSDHSSFCDFIKHNKSIKFLKISGNDLTHHVSISLADALSELKALEYLSLSENTCDLDLEKVIKSLSIQQTVAELQIYMNNIPEAFWEKSAEDLVWPRLKKLVLGFGINENIVKSLAQKPVDVFFRNHHYCVSIKDMIS